MKAADAAAQAITAMTTGGGGGVTNKIKARILLRVKRRRPSPTTTATTLTNTNAQDVHAGSADNSVGGAIIAPDRIQLVLPSTKRRKIVGEEMALAQGFESSVSFHPSAAENEKDVANTDAIATDAATANIITATTNNPLLQTPSRSRGRSLANSRVGNRIISIPTDPNPNGIIQHANVNSTSHDYLATNNNTKTPAPPTKLRRAIFRKITDLQKRLDPTSLSITTTTANTTIASVPAGNEVPMPLVPFSKENVYNASSSSSSSSSMERIAAAAASGAAAAGAETTATWSSKGEEKSKWLRVVDVMLKDELEEVVEEKEDICRGYEGDVPKGEMERVQRVRERESGGGDNDVVGDSGGDGQRRKRRKVELVVEQSRTVLESDFWNQSYADAGASTSDGNTNNDSNIYYSHVLEPETVQLIENSLTALHQQGGGSVMPHLSFLNDDPRVCYKANTPRGKRMINHALSRGVDNISSANGDLEQNVGKGRTVLHIAALWGDLAGVHAALEMGADPTIFDALGYSPTGLARKGGYDTVVATLVEGERKARHDKNIRSDEHVEEEYYYDLYCLEADVENDESEKVDNRICGCGGGESRYLQLKDGTSTINTDSIPDLEHSTNLSEDDTDTNSSGNLSRWASSIELQKGFGYWNEQGELILDVAGGGGTNQDGSGGCYSSDDNDRIVQRYYHNGNIDGDDSMGGNEDDHDSNDEGYDGNDYPDDVSNSLIDSDDYDDYRDADACIENNSYCSDDSGDEWRLDFRNRCMPKNNIRCSDDDEFAGVQSEEELYD
ncbi:hypothetical protein ACHAWU_006747 [Discostella pseudostelligera]|uniref:Uncharacterized protein n=1 Tax=Discostella pseudostelligera TaxID=259834 RepID=A0ABD3N8Y8_9STRA